MSSESTVIVKKTDGRAIALGVLRNLDVLLGVAAVVFFILAIMPSSWKALYWSLFAGCALACAALVYPCRLLSRKVEKHTIAGAKRPAFWGYAALVFLTLVVLIPFWVLLVTSVKTPAEVNGAAFTWWPQMGFQFESFRAIFTDDSTGFTLLGAFGNTLLYYLPTTLVCVLVSSLSAYAFSKLHFPGKNILFSFLLFTMMVPGCVTLTSSYLMFDAVHLTGTPWPLILPGLFGSVTMIFFLREYYSGIPDELLEAARVEGAGKLTVYAMIIFPIGIPALLAQFILDFIVRYNDYLSPLIYLRWEEEFTLQLALNYYGSQGSIGNAQLAAACLVGILPLLVIYLILQKYILKGIAVTSGLKG